MIIEESVKVKDYKCFASEPQGFEKIYPVNIIIGKNNSGKSSLIDLIEFIVSPSADFIVTGRGRTMAEVSFCRVLERKDVEQLIVNNDMYNNYLSPLLNKSFTYSLNIGIEKDGEVVINDILEDAPNIKKGIEPKLKKLFFDKTFKRINAERDVTPEFLAKEFTLASSGKNATSIVTKLLNEKGMEHNIIKKDFIKCINEITAPDIIFDDIIVKRDPKNDEWEIFLEDDNGYWVALSKMGSGIKTIILVLLNLIVSPKLEFKNPSKYVFGFEELENNLHPSLQRRLFSFIREYAKEFETHFFITTHSNIVIDLFGNDPLSQIIHVKKQGDNSIATSISSKELKNILKDLDFKASDILLSNGIIWVEGPSDAIYIELFLDLYAKANPGNDLQRLSFTIQSLATAVWKYAGFIDFDWNLINEDIQNKIISLSKLNHNHLLVIDNDGNYDDKKPSEWEQFSNGTGRNKAKLIYECVSHNNASENNLENNFGDSKNATLLFWINDGTFETYLSHFIKDKGKEFAKYFQTNKQNSYLEKKRDGDDSSISKVLLASDIAQFCLENELTINDIAPKDSDLYNKIARLYNTIKSWN